MNYDGKRVVIIDWETFFSRKDKYDIKSMSIATYIRDSRFWPLGLAYRFLDDEQTHWLPGVHPIEAWVAAVDWSNTVVVSHNAKFDCSILAWKYGVKAFAYMDTVTLAKAVIGGNVPGYSLKRLAEYLGFPAKGEMKCEGVKHLTPQQAEELGTYCKNDVEICWRIYEKFITQFPQSQLQAMDWTIRAFIEPKLVLDVQCLERGIKNEKARREEIIKASGVDKDTLSSNKQFAEYLASKGYAVPTKLSARTNKQIPAFAKTDTGLSQIGQLNPELYAARIASKSNLLETRGESLLAVAKTGLFPFDVAFSGAQQTHRYSGGSGAGGNPQNFTRNSFLRDAICAPEGYQLVVGDFAAIELRLLAWLAKEPKLMSKIINDEDIYSDFASLKYGRKITKADKAERQFGKGAILGLGYCLSGDTTILTDSGPKNISTVDRGDKVWTGQNYENHGGLAPQGMKGTISLPSLGINATPDHWVLCENGWHTAVEIVSAVGIRPLLSESPAVGVQSSLMNLSAAQSGVSLCAAYAAAKKRSALISSTWENVCCAENVPAHLVVKKGETLTDAQILFLIQNLECVGGLVSGMQNGDALTLTRKTTRGTAVVGSDLVSRTGVVFWNTLLLSAGLVNQVSPWTELITTETMSVEIYESLAKKLITQTVETYDLIDAGFTSTFQAGMGLVHNSMGAKKFKATIKAQTGMDISEEEAWKTVDLYRTTYFNVPKLWEQAHAILPLLSTGQVGCLWFAPFIKVKKNTLILPSGLAIKYPNLRSISVPGRNGPQVEWVYDVYHKVYEAETTKLYGGKIIENICQALAGELCKEAIERAEQSYQMDIVGQVHDEILAICRNQHAEGSRLELQAAMERSPKWMPTLRLKSEVNYGKNWNETK